MVRRVPSPEPDRHLAGQRPIYGPLRQWTWNRLSSRLRLQKRHDVCVPIEMPPGERKYQTEFTLDISIQGSYVLRAQDLERVSTETMDSVQPCHLYVISRAPRISIDPASIAITENRLTGSLRAQRQQSYDEYDFEGPHSLGDGPLTWKSAWPYESFEIVNQDAYLCSGELPLCWGEGRLSGLATSICMRFFTLAKRSASQASGRHLKKHETLQRILAEQTPGTQVWLTLASICDVVVLQETSPVKGRVTDDEDTAHGATVLHTTHRDGFMDREAVALAEAGLIRGWQPDYNNHFKYNFPARKEVSLETARDLDLHGFIVVAVPRSAASVLVKATRSRSPHLFRIRGSLRSEPFRTLSLQAVNYSKRTNG